MPDGGLGSGDRLAPVHGIDRRAVLKAACAGLGGLLLGSCSNGSIVSTPPTTAAPATFVHAPSTIRAGTRVTFTDTTPGATAWRWTFGDGQPSRRLIKTGWDNPTPRNLAANIELVESRPFHGVCIELPDVSHVTLLPQRQSRAQVDDALAPLRDVTFSRLTHNFVYCVLRTPSGENNFTGERAWATATRNFADLAASVAAHGLRGICFDNEQYYGDLWTGSPSDAGLAYARGRDLMAAAIDAAPEIEVLVYLGGWWSDVSSSEVLSRAGIGLDPAESKRVPNLGPFFAGMVHATMGTSARVIDGNEFYSLRTARHFQAMRDWAKHGVARSAPFIPDDDRDRYGETVSIAFGVFDRPIGPFDMNPDIWRTTLVNALAACDHYVWMFTERFTWLGSGPDPHPQGRPLEPVTDDWLAATEGAFASLHQVESTDRSPSHVFAVPGVYAVGLTVITPTGERSVVKQVRVEPA